MNNSNLIRLSMCEKNYSFNTSQATITATAGISTWPTLVSTQGTSIQVIHGYMQIADSPITGTTQSVLLSRNQMQQAAYKIANALYSYASDPLVNDLELQAKSKTTISSFKKLAKDRIYDRCVELHDLGVVNAANILDYNCSATDISNAASLNAIYYAKINNTESAIDIRKNANQNADNTLDDLILNLMKKQIDPLANTLRYSNSNSNSNWWRQYRESRQIINVGQGTTRITYTVMQGTSPVNAATASIFNKMVLKKPRTKPYPVQTSTPEGIIIHNKLGTGLFDITISKEEYLDKVLLNNRVKLGDSLDLGIIQFTLAPKSGILLPAEIRNLFSPDSPFWTVGQKIQVKNTTASNPSPSPIVFYPAQKPNDAYSGSNGETLTNGQEVSIIISITDLPAYINVTNLGTLPATFEIKFM